MTIIAVANQKGGVGKTTTAVNLAAAFADMGKDVVLVDIDAQGNASTGLGVPPAARKVSSYDLLLGEAEFVSACLRTNFDGLSIVPANGDLSSAEIALANSRDRLGALKSGLRDGPKSPSITIIDCPPALGLLTLNALVAADFLLVPLQSEFYALEGLSHLLDTVREVRAAANRDLRLAGVVLTMADHRNRLSQQVEADARENLGDLVFETVIPRNVRVSEAPSYGQPVLQYDPNSKGAEAYRGLAKEFMRKFLGGK